jgi:hypothetical protein
MNQDQVKDRLLNLHDCTEKFTVIFSGKKSKKVNGLYKPDTHEIIIHNRNFGSGDNVNNDLLFYTAMHELAHHIQFTELHQKSVRSHTALFYSTLDDLVDIAEKKGLYKMPIDDDTQKLIDIADEISCEIAGMQRKLGGVLNRLYKVCQEKGIRFEDVVERKIQLARNTLKNSIKANDLNIPGGINADIQEAAIKERDDEKRAAIIKAGEEGKSIDQAKRAIATPPVQEDEAVSLMKEKARLERTINSLTRRLEEVTEHLQTIGED